jgi:hypothetical protein
MKQIVTYLSLFGAGLALGVLGTKTYFERKYKKIADDEIESVKEVFKRKTVSIVEADATAKRVETPNVDPDFGIEIEKVPVGGGLFMNMVPEHMKEMQIKYNTLSNDIVEGEHPIEGNYRPYIIDVDTFDETADGYSKVELSYYMGDSTLVDSEEEIVSTADTIGIDNLELFEHLDEDVFYVRNESLGADYEVTKVLSSYSQIVGDDY